MAEKLSGAHILLAEDNRFNQQIAAWLPNQETGNEEEICCQKHCRG